MRLCIVIASVVLAIASLAVHAQELNIQPGKWEYEQVTKFEGDVQVPEQRRATTQCVTREDIEQRSVMPDLKQGECEMRSKEVRGSSMNYEMTCQGPQGNRTTMQMEMQYNGDQANGTMEMDVEDQPMRMVTTINGRCLGGC